MKTLTGIAEDAYLTAIEAGAKGDGVWAAVVGSILNAMKPSSGGPYSDRIVGFEMAAHHLRVVGEADLAEWLTSARLQPGEPVFHLRAQDRLAPGAIRAWITSAEVANVPEWKIEAARDFLEKIERWPGEKHYPD